jgi:hypothetical protein
VSVSDLVAFHDVIVGNFLAGISVHLGVFDAVASLSVDLVEADFLGIGSSRIQSDQVTSERRKKPFQLARGPFEILQTLQKLRVQNSVAGIVPAFK